MYFSGMGSNWSENQIIEYLEQAGSIECISLLRYVDGCPQGSGCVQYERMADAYWCWKQLDETRCRPDPNDTVESVCWISPATKEYILDRGCRGVIGMFNNLGWGCRADIAGDSAHIRPDSDLHNLPWQRREGYADAGDLIYKIHGREWRMHIVDYNKKNRDRDFLDVRQKGWPYIDASKLGSRDYSVPELDRYNLQTPWNGMVTD